MGKRELVRDMVVATRERLRSDGWNVGIDDAREDGRKGKSISVKIRVHGDLRHTVDFLETLVPSREGRLIDFLTIHPRTRATPSTQPINLEALGLLTDILSDRVPILVSGDVFALSQLPYRSPSLRASLRPPSPAERDGRGENGGDDDRDSVQQQEQSRASSHPPPPPADDGSIVEIPKLAGLMSARALLANPALFAGHDTCPWEAVERFMANVARAPLPLRLTLHHLSEMCGPGYGRDKTPLLSRKERQALLELTNMCDVIDFLDEKVAVATGRPDGMRRSFDGGG